MQIDNIYIVIHKIILKFSFDFYIQFLKNKPKILSHNIFVTLFVMINKLFPAELIIIFISNFELMGVRPNAPPPRIKYGLASFFVENISMNGSKNSKSENV